MSGSLSFGVISISVIFVLFLYAVCGAFFEHKHFHLIHETGLGIVLGMLCGLMFQLIPSLSNQLYNFNGTFFFYILLPIIIFCGGYNLNKRRFAENFFYIMLFGILGTILTFLFIFGFTKLINSYDLIVLSNNDVIKLSSENMMIFAATICASDSVAALTMIKPDKYPKLFSVVFGEGMVNDAVAIILFISVELISDTSGGSNWKMPLELILLFIKEFFGSILVGLFFGLFTTLLFKKLRFLTDSVILEVCIILYTGYASFAVCELIELSGVISVLVCGIVLAHYNFYNLCNIGQVSSKVTLNSLSLFCESFIYVYLGLAIWAVKNNGAVETEMTYSWKFVLYQIAICFTSRGLSLFILTMISQIFKGRKNFKLSFWELNIVWFAGLIRGSVAYALIQKLSYHGDNEDEIRQIELLKTTVLFMVVSTTILLGALMPWYIVTNLQIQENRSSKRKIANTESIRVTFLGEIQGGKGEDYNQKRKKSKLIKWFQHVEEKYFKNWFIFEYAQRKGEIKEIKKLSRAQADQSHTSRRQTVQIVDRQSSNPNARISKVLYRSTFNSKFLGVQEVVMAIDIPDDNRINLTDEELKTQHQFNDHNVIKEEAEEHLESSNIRQ